MKVFIKNIKDYVGQEVTLEGWLYNKRSSGKIKFLIVRDGTGFIQCVVSKKDISEQEWDIIDKLHQESSIRVVGKVSFFEKAPYCKHELTVSKFELVSNSQEDYPISHKEHGIDFLLENRHLWLRTPKQNAIMKIRHRIIKSCRDFFDNKGFVLVDAPIFTPNACEGTTELFEVKYFDDSAYLTQSGQLYMEAAAFALGNVYCFGPTFRSEKSKTRRHLTEFWMIEPEMTYIDLEDNLKIQEEMVSYVVQEVLKSCQDELKILERDTTKLENIKAPFPRLSYTDAVELLKSEGSNIEWGSDLGAPDETIIASKYDKPVFIHRFPTICKAFYMKPDPENPDVVLGADLLAPEGYGEIIGGGQRIDDYDLLLQRIKDHNLPEDAFKWYLELRKYGSVPHGGFGMGIERCTAWICGVEHVRETIPFPRTIYRIYP
ncbi:MAG: asparagine--tRNA ligase [Candidatus Sericytochromatia bacterium]|nr:MAG: asparagine--tRNA ligase [Candidatus Sericytochromatia bacterium]